MVMGNQVTSTEVLVIGAGPGGYVAAIRAAQLGYDVLLVDKHLQLGGMCLHHGCIPSKALIHASSLFYDASHSEHLGITGSLKLDLNKTQAWKKQVISKLHNGIAALLKQNNVRVVKATARFQSDSQVVLSGDNLDFNAVEFRHAIIATGSKPRELPWAPFGGRVLSSKQVLDLEEVPGSVCVVGAGYIGMELGMMLAKAGSKVTVIEAASRILSVVDEDLADVVALRAKQLGVSILTDTKLASVEQSDSGVTVNTNKQSLSADYVLVSIGHVPVIEDLQLDLAGVELENGFIKVDEQCRTSNPRIFAVGDVTGGIMLAHTASAQGKVAAAVIAGKNEVYSPKAVPAVVFTDPEVASTGLSESEAKKLYPDCKVARFPFSALGKALAEDQPVGFTKIITTSDGVLLGLHAVGPGVSNTISAATLAIEMGALAEDVALTIHPHPTLSESLAESAQAIIGESVHTINK